MGRHADATGTAGRDARPDTRNTGEGLDSVTETGCATDSATDKGNNEDTGYYRILWIDYARSFRTSNPHERLTGYDRPSDEEAMQLPVSYTGGYGWNDEVLRCQVCDRGFRSRQPRLALYCSARCSNDAYIARRRERRAAAREKTCEVCGEEFTPARKDAKTCSLAGKQKAYRQRQRA